MMSFLENRNGVCLFLLSHLFHPSPAEEKTIHNFFPNQRHNPMKSHNITRRNFLRNASLTGAVALTPGILPARLFGQDAPSNTINVACIGVGRMGRGDMNEFMGFSNVRVVAVADVDSKRADDGKAMVDKKYGDTKCAVYTDYRDLLERDDLDVVSIVTPDHWHVKPAIDAANKGLDIFLQKPLSVGIHEGRVLSDTVRDKKRVFQMGSQQRSDARFRHACELVRNGRIGEIKLVKVGFGTDPIGGEAPIMPIPENLNYEMWLGPAPLKPYTEKRVHPQDNYGRPGWLRIRDYGHGMITGWGSHHNDIAQWGLGTEYSGPTEIEGWGEYAETGLWDVHGKFRIEYTYPNGVKVICADNEQNPQGVRFEGTDGWIQVRRGAIEASDPKILEWNPGPNDVQLYVSNNHKGNFLECIKTRKETVAPVEIGHRSCTMCILGSMAMELKRKLRWDPKNERFLDDPTANSMVTRARRAPWTL
jgi:predicted dehydrogenase